MVGAENDGSTLANTFANLGFYFVEREEFFKNKEGEKLSEITRCAREGCGTFLYDVGEAVTL